MVAGARGGGMGAGVASVQRRRCKFASDHRRHHSCYRHECRRPAGTLPSPLAATSDASDHACTAVQRCTSAVFCCLRSTFHILCKGFVPWVPGCAAPDVESNRQGEFHSPVMLLMPFSRQKLEQRRRPCHLFWWRAAAAFSFHAYGRTSPMCRLPPLICTPDLHAAAPHCLKK